jgi:hypothetical protein
VRRHKTLIALVTTLVALALMLASCGGDDNEGTTTSPAPAAAPPSGSAEPPSLSKFPPEFLACLEDQGIDLESVTDVSAVIHSPEGKRCFELLHGG